MNRMLFVVAAISASSALADPALLSPVKVEAATLAKGEVTFCDRTYCFNDLPNELCGKPFLRGSIDAATEVAVERDGDLTILTPVSSSFVSQSNAVASAGFVRCTDIAPFFLFGKEPCNKVEVWKKRVKAGEKFAFGKWYVICGFDKATKTRQLPEHLLRIKKSLIGTVNEKYALDILVNNPEYVVYIPKQPRDVSLRDNSKRGDTYNDHFQVINDDKRGLLYAFWTQASKEADIDQHIAFSKSSDWGKTWSEPELLAGSPNKRNPAPQASWQQPMLSKSGRLYCLWGAQTSNMKPSWGTCWGAFSDDAGENWSSPMQVEMQRMDADPADPTKPPSWCNWQRPLRLGEGGKFFVGCSRHGKAPYDDRFGCKIEFWQYDNIDDDPEVENIKIKCFSTNRDALSAPALEGLGGFKDSQPAIEEAGIVRLPDGRLFAMMRSSVGSPVWSQSRDFGRTWSRPKLLLDRDGGKPYLHPRSPCPIYDWKGPEAGSGKYFALVHNTFDFKGKTAYQRRGPLYLIAGTFMPNADQPIWFKEPKLFAPRADGNSFYTSYCVVNGKGVLWFNDMKFYLLGRTIGPEWFE